MKLPGQNKQKKGLNQKDGIHLRRKYVDPSLQFLNWVNSLGFGKSRFGRWLVFAEERFHLQRVTLVSAFCLILAPLLYYEFDFAERVDVGEVAIVDIKSPIALQIVDEDATAQKQQEEADAIPAVLDFDYEVYEGVYARISRAFQEMRHLVRQQRWLENEYEREEQIKEFVQHRAKFEQLLGVEVSGRTFEWLVEEGFSARIENILIRAIGLWGGEKTIDSLDSLSLVSATAESASIVPVGGAGNEFMLPISSIVDLKKRQDLTLKDVRGAGALRPVPRERLTRLARKLMVPNLTFNRKETVARKAAARESVLPVQISLRRNQTIVAAGAVVMPIHVKILNEIHSKQSKERTYLMSVMTAALLVLMAMVFFSYLRRFSLKRVRVSDKDLLVMGTVTIIVGIITKLFLFTTHAAFLDRFGSMIPPSVFMFAAPVAAGPMLVGLLITSGEVVWVFTVFMAAALGFMVDMDYGFLMVSVVGGIAAARGVYGCTRRNDIYWAGLRTGLVNMAAIVFLAFLTSSGLDELLRQLLWTAPAGFVGGVLSSMVAMMLVPLLESGFNYTTDIKLMELANLNHPLMQEMMMKSPGTYHHSISVGNMVEAAAKEIGANALLAKVMALYHDIGKMEHAQYFIENQSGYNPHDHISPFMSKTILVAHVKDGAELGLKHKLGTPIIDGILQHHGTTLISYFYNRAVEEMDENIDHVDENEFRYPGPKPQFKEAALVMLADSIEATARTLDEPTPSRLQNIVKNIIQSKFIDGQLDECNLTLRDLSTIETAFRKILLGIYHQRMDYPHMRDGKVVSVPQPGSRPKGSSKKGSHVG